VRTFIRYWTPDVALSAGRLVGALSGPLRSPGLGPEDAVHIGATLYQFARSVARARTGAAGRSWLFVFLILSAEGAVAELPSDAGAQFLQDLAEGAAAMGAFLAGVLVAVTAYRKVLPLLRARDPVPQPAPFLHADPGFEPWWKTRVLGRGAAGGWVP
jgi:hypothetical protein